MLQRHARDWNTARPLFPGELLTRLVQLALRYIHTDQPVERLREPLALMGQIEDQSEATRILHTLLRYYANANPALDRKGIGTIVNEIPNGEVTMPTLSELWAQEGQAKMLLRQISRKFGPPSDELRQRIAAADEDTLLEWSERILDAESLDAVLH
jgi:hypothetical protein